MLQFGQFLWPIFKFKDFFLQSCPIYRWVYQRQSSSLLLCFIYSIYIRLCLLVFISWLNFHQFTHVIHLSTKAWSSLITVILNSLSNSPVPASESFLSLFLLISSLDNVLLLMMVVMVVVVLFCFVLILLVLSKKIWLNAEYHLQGNREKIGYASSSNVKFECWVNTNRNWTLFGFCCCHD